MAARAPPSTATEASSRGRRDDPHATTSPAQRARLGAHHGAAAVTRVDHGHRRGGGYRPRLPHPTPTASIADDAALSGSQAIDLPELHAGHLELEPGQARAEALRTITANPSTTGQATATTGSVTVTVTRRVPTILLGLVGVRTLTISAHATAAPRGP